LEVSLDFFTFINEKKKKEKFEPLPLYIEVVPESLPLPRKTEEEENKRQDSGIIIIQMV
jgi:hypothetical protein